MITIEMNGFRLIYKTVTSPNFMPLLVVIVFAYLASKSLLGQGYFNMHDDLQMMRQLEMEKCFQDMQIPCRWVPDMGYGFGYPLFNFYPPLPYLVGQVFRLFGFSFVDTAKLLFVVSFFASGATMYFLAKAFFGRVGGAISSIFYIWAPYHAVDVYVRGAMNESWALIWFPLILYTSYRLLKTQEFEVIWDKKSKLLKNLETLIIGEKIKWALALSLSWFCLFTSHNLMVIVFTPFFAVWSLIWILKNKSLMNFLLLAASGIFSFLLAAFFSVPVFLEKGVVQTNTLVQGYYEYTAHFPSFAQLFTSRFWGYGPSVWMTQDDRMSFQIGWLHWALGTAVSLSVFWLAYKKRQLKNFTFAVGFAIFLAFFAAFLAHPRSTPIWQSIEAMRFIQFPWRYLTMVILGFSFAAGGIALFFGKTKRIFVLLILGVLLVLYGRDYFLPENGKLGKLTDEEKFTGAAWELQQTAGIYDYLPNTAKTAPKGKRTVIAEFMEGKGEVKNENVGTNWLNFDLVSEGEGVVRINQMYFPDWKVKVNGQEVKTFIPETEEWGRFYMNVPKGSIRVEAKLHDTWPRTLGNILSIIAWGCFGLILYFRRRSVR